MKKQFPNSNNALPWHMNSIKMQQEDAPHKSRKIDGQDHEEEKKVVCRTKQRTFPGKVIGYYKNSAIVSEAGKEPTVISYRNLYDYYTGEPLRKTNRDDAVYLSGAQRTAYIPTQKEYKQWRVEKKINISQTK